MWLHHHAILLNQGVACTASLSLALGIALAHASWGGVRARYIANRVESVRHRWQCGVEICVAPYEKTEHHTLRAAVCMSSDCLVMTPSPHRLARRRTLACTLSECASPRSLSSDHPVTLTPSTLTTLTTLNTVWPLPWHRVWVRVARINMNNKYSQS